MGESSGEGTDTVQSDVDFYILKNVENLILLAKMRYLARKQRQQRDYRQRRSQYGLWIRRKRYVYCFPRGYNGF